jgi:REP element-mobilizing transposase RayT
VRSDLGQASSLSSAFQQRRFLEYENLLHQAVCGPLWLKDPELASIVSDAIMFRDSQTHAVDAYCVMPNHVHLVLAPLAKDGPDLEPTSLASIMHSVKSYTGNQANKVLNRGGSFWEHENFDRAIRNEEEWLRTIAYVLNNPVKACLVQDWQDWPHSYCRPQLAPE